MFEKEAQYQFPEEAAFNGDQAALAAVFDQLFPFVIVVLGKEIEFECTGMVIKADDFPDQVQGIDTDAGLLAGIWVKSTAIFMALYCIIKQWIDGIME